MEPAQEVLIPREADPLDALLDRALRGDAESLDVFFKLLTTRYGKLVSKKLRHHRGDAHTAALEDAFQQGMIAFMEEIQAGALPELAPGERRDILAHFQKHCDRRLAAGKANKHAQRERENCELHENLTRDVRVDRAEPEAPLFGEPRRTEVHRALLHAHIARLSEFERGVLEDYLLGIPYDELARRTGRNIQTLRAIVFRVKHRLADEMARVSQTARLEQQNKIRASRPSGVQSPGSEAAAIHAAIRRLPKEAQEAVTFVHLEGGTLEELAEFLGERGLEKARTRLNRAYESLSAKLNLPFPRSFSLLRADPDA